MSPPVNLPWEVNAASVAGVLGLPQVSLLGDGTFLRAFRSKGRFAPILDEIPVRVILDDRAALIDAALAAAPGGPYS